MNDQESTVSQPWFTNGCERCKYYKSINSDEGECINEHRNEKVPADLNSDKVYVAAWWVFNCLELK